VAYVAFQGAFAAITCGLIVGAFAERIKFSAVLLFMVIWFTLRYLPMAHMVWYWAGPDAYTDAEAAKKGKPRPASCSRRARSTSPAAPWCTSTPP
jgi:Amt family ammonium transporter